MNQIGVLMKLNLKLLLRNKGFIFFLLILPVFSLLILNLRETEIEVYGDASEGEIYEWGSPDKSITYVADMAYYTMKVYDSSRSKITEYILEQLIDTGIVFVSRYRSDEMSEEEILEKIEKNAYFDRLGTILYFPPNFEDEILKGNFENALKIFQVSDDDRQEIVTETIQSNIIKLAEASEYASGDSEKLLGMMKSLQSGIPAKNVIQMSSNHSQTLTSEQRAHKEHIGYSYAIISLSFLFCGIFIAYTVIEERDHRVFTRIMLTKANEATYILSKLGLSILISMVQTAILGVGIYTIVQPKLGINKMSYLFLVFLLGIILNILSLCVGVLFDNIMGANYTVFSIWSISCLLSGLYFTLENANSIFLKISYLMPQKWFLRAAERMILNDASVYGMAVGVTVAYLMVILSFGAAGLRLKHEI